MSGRGFGWLLAGLAPVYLTLAAVLPPADDELYYWCWSEQLQWSYYDHPPMTAYLIRAATSVCGDTLFAIRLPAVLSTLTVLAVVGALSRPRALLPFVVFTPLFTLGAVLVTPDTPLLMFWALYLLWLVKTHEALTPTAGLAVLQEATRTEAPSRGPEPPHPPGPPLRSGEGGDGAPALPSASSVSAESQGAPRPIRPSPSGRGAGPGAARTRGEVEGRHAGSPYGEAPSRSGEGGDEARDSNTPTPCVPGWLWLVGGVVLGCGILGKYTTGLAVIGGFLTFAVAVPWRRWVVGYAAHLAVAFVVTLPILIHNIRHDFAPLLYQWKHSMSSPEPGFGPFFGFVGIQLLLFGTVPFVAFGWALVNRHAILADPKLRACAGLFVFPFAFFLYKATRGPLEGNWALACYIAAWPLAAVWYDRLAAGGFWRRAAPFGFTLPALAVVLLAAHLVHPLPFLSPRSDRLTRQYSKMTIARDVAAAVRAQGWTQPVFVASYQWAALLRFHGIDAHQIDGITRPSHFTQTPETLAGRDHVLVFTDEIIPEETTAGFDPPRRVAMFPLVVRGELIDGYWLLEFTRPPAGTAAARLDRPGGVFAP